MKPRILAVDWSGAAERAHKTIWLAEARGASLVRLEDGRNRDELTTHLIKETEHDSQLVVGLDFAFSLPEWFLEQRGLGTGHDLWQLVERQGESWLKDCDPPFWGRPGRKRPPDTPDEFRHTDRQVPGMAGIRPKSVFQIGGAGAVGTGSLRGMPSLRRLSEAGYSIWPFDAPRFPLAIEIYPRVLTGPVTKSNADARRAYLDKLHPELDAGLRDLAVSSEDAFDAAVSALVMARHAGELSNLPLVSDIVSQREGIIWYPADLGSEQEARTLAEPAPATGPPESPPQSIAVAESDSKRKPAPARHRVGITAAPEETRFSSRRREASEQQEQPREESAGRGEREFLYCGTELVGPKETRALLDPPYRAIWCPPFPRKPQVAPGDRVWLGWRTKTGSRGLLLASGRIETTEEGSVLWTNRTLPGVRDKARSFGYGGPTNMAFLRLANIRLADPPTDCQVISTAPPGLSALDANSVEQLERCFDA